MALPFLILVGSLYAFIKIYGGAIAEQAQQRAEQQAAARRAILQNRQAGGNFTGGGANVHQQGNVPFQQDGVFRRNVPPAAGSAF